VTKDQETKNLKKKKLNLFLLKNNNNFFYRMSSYSYLIQLVRGRQPRERWFKLNCDDVYKSSVHLLECGGILCDNNGNCVSSLARKIGSCDALRVEMLEHVHHNGFNLKTRDNLFSSGE
jgi:hypothetical protein